MDNMNRLLLVSLVLFITPFCMAQKAERDYIRKGNKNFNDSTYINAEVNYRKAIDVNPQSTVAMNNLGNTLTQQQKFEEAMEQYVTATKIEKDKDRLGEIFHNMGVIFQAAEDYPKAIEAYKESLRNNPRDHETRYNLALAQKMLKDQEQNQDQQDGEDDKEENKQDQEEQQEQDQKNQENQPQQPPQSEEQMSKENAEQLLKAVLQDEKEVQDKVKKQQQVIQGGQLDKNW
ncbi:MAG: tetratricopeptide repeat protein [Bacteroidales bacterium]|nr:tetratricopeptide repeat protein [Bacteroidales bacterium]